MKNNTNQHDRRQSDQDRILDIAATLSTILTDAELLQLTKALENIYEHNEKQRHSQRSQ